MPTARSLSDRLGDRLNVRDFGATGDGTTDDGAAISACTLAALNGGKDVSIPAGTYRVTGANPMVLRPNVAIYMDRRVTLICDSSASGSADVITNFGQGGHYAIHGGTVQGLAETMPTPGTHNLTIYYADSVLLDGVQTRYSRKFGFAIINCGQATVRGCNVYRTLADGIAVWDTPNHEITGNIIQGANDDAISAHCNDNIALPRAGGLIANNIISESSGISVLGAKAVTIANNVMRRMMGYGVYVGPFLPSATGDTASFGVKIVGNAIYDVFRRAEPTPRNAQQAYIVLALGVRQTGGAAAAPGDPAPGTGVVAPMLGSGTGTLYAQGTSVAAPGNLWFDISGNTLVRTLPASTAWSQWGYGTTLWVGDNSPTGLYLGGIPEANLNTCGIQLSGSLRNSRISGNTIETTSVSGIWVVDSATVRKRGFRRA